MIRKQHKSQSLLPDAQTAVGCRLWLCATHDLGICPWFFLLKTGIIWKQFQIYRDVTRRRILQKIIPHISFTPDIPFLKNHLIISYICSATSSLLSLFPLVHSCLPALESVPESGSPQEIVAEQIFIGQIRKRRPKEVTSLDQSQVSGR